MGQRHGERYRSAVEVPTGRMAIRTREDIVKLYHANLISSHGVHSHILHALRQDLKCSSEKMMIH